MAPMSTANTNTEGLLLVLDETLLVSLVVVVGARVVVLRTMIVVWFAGFVGWVTLANSSTSSISLSLSISDC